MLAEQSGSVYFGGDIEVEVSVVAQHRHQYILALFGLDESGGSALGKSLLEIGLPATIHGRIVDTFGLQFGARLAGCLPGTLGWTYQIVILLQARGCHILFAASSCTQYTLK